MPYCKKLYYNMVRVPLDFLQGWVSLLYFCAKKEDKSYMIMPIFIGDVVYAMAFMNAYVLQKRKKIVIVAEEKKSELIRSYNVKGAEYLFLDGTKWLWRISQSMSRCNVTRNIAYKLDIYSLNPYHIPNDKDNCLDILLSKLGIKEGTKPQYYESVTNEVTAIPDFYSVKDRVIVLNPYSNSMSTEMDFFDEISSGLKEKGFIPYTNVVAGQRVLKGSMKLTCSLKEFYSICNQIPYVISVRTGLMDMVAATSAKKLVLYFDSSKLNKFLRLYRMKAWQRENVVEYVYDNKESACETIENFINA